MLPVFRHPLFRCPLQCLFNLLYLNLHQQHPRDIFVLEFSFHLQWPVQWGYSNPRPRTELDFSNFWFLFCLSPRTRRSSRRGSRRSWCWPEWSVAWSGKKKSIKLWKARSKYRQIFVPNDILKNQQLPLSLKYRHLKWEVVVSIGRLTTFYVVLVPMENIPSIPPHYYLWFNPPVQWGGGANICGPS